MAHAFGNEVDSQTSSISSIEESSYTSFSSLDSLGSSDEIPQDDSFEYLASKDYCQNVDIGRVTVKRGQSRGRFLEKKKCGCDGDDEIGQSKDKRSTSRQRPNKTTFETSRSTHNNDQNGPRVAIQFDLNELLKEISKFDKKVCALCGKPKNKNKTSNDCPSKKLLNLNALQDGKFSFLLNNNLKITIEDDSLQRKNKSKRNLDASQKSDTSHKIKEQKKSSTYTNSSDAYPVETMNKIPCPSSCPLVKLKRLLAPDDQKVLSCMSRKSKTTNTPSSRNKQDRSLQTSKNKECGTNCSRKKIKSKRMNMLQSDDIKVSCKGEDGEKKVTQEIVKEGDNVKIIIRVKKPNNQTLPSEKYYNTYPTYSSTSKLRSSYDSKHENSLNRDEETFPHYSERKTSSVRNYSFITNGNTDSRSRRAEFSTINIIMSPKSTRNQISKSEETISESKECWSKLEEFIDRKIQEFKPNTTTRQNACRKLVKGTRKDDGRDSNGKKSLNEYLDTPSSILIVRCKSIGTNDGIPPNESAPKECFIANLNSDDGKSNSENISKKSEATKKILEDCNHFLLSMESASVESTNYCKRTKSEGYMLDNETLYRSKTIRTESLCNVERREIHKNSVEDSVEKTRVIPDERKESARLNEISIQTDLELSQIMKENIPDVQERLEDHEGYSTDRLNISCNELIQCESKEHENVGEGKIPEKPTETGRDIHKMNIKASMSSNTKQENQSNENTKKFDDFSKKSKFISEKSDIPKALPPMKNISKAVSMIF